MVHVGLLIPCTSRNRPEWKDIRDTYLYKLSLITFLTKQTREYSYTFYIGYDADDRIFASEVQHDHIYRFSQAFPNVTFKFVKFEDVQRGHLTRMWNILFKRAYDDGCEYFYQCGDDIAFNTNDWVRDSVLTMKQNNDIGLTGPINNNNRILTQAFVSRKHMEIFGWFFPEEIINWCCDDWYNLVYKPSHFFPLSQHFCSNQGGVPRYVIHNNEMFTRDLLNNTTRLRQATADLSEKHKIILRAYLSSTTSLV